MQVLLHLEQPIQVCKCQLRYFTKFHDSTTARRSHNTHGILRVDSIPRVYGSLWSNISASESDSAPTTDIFLFLVAQIHVCSSVCDDALYVVFQRFSWGIIMIVPDSILGLCIWWKNFNTRNSKWKIKSRSCSGKNSCLGIPIMKNIRIN